LGSLALGGGDMRDQGASGKCSCRCMLSRRSRLDLSRVVEANTEWGKMVDTIAFVGLGAMGLPMARNLVQKQFRVVGYDVRPQAVEALAEAGGHGAKSAREAAEGAN